MDNTQTESQVRDLATKGRVGKNVNGVVIQETALNKAMEFMGTDFWFYVKGTSQRYPLRAQLLVAVRETCGYELSYATLMRWIDYYHKYGEAPARSRRNLNYKKLTIKGIRARRTNKKFKTSDQEALIKIIHDEPQLYLDEIVAKLATVTGKVWHPTTVWRHLQSINYSLKQAVFRAKQQSQEEVDAYFVRLNDRLQHPRQLIFVDETARGANASRRRRAWSPKGITPVVSAPMVREFDKRYTLIGACNWEGFIPSACRIVEREQGNNDPNPDRGTVDATRFEEYVEYFLVPSLGKAVNQEPNSIVVMDNAAIHCTERVVELIEEAGALLVFTAPYSPEYNPIENMFGEYKKSLRRHAYTRDIHWFDVHWQALQSVSPAMAKQFFKHCKVPMMEEWLEEQAARNRSDFWEFLPEPLNELMETLIPSSML